MGKSGLLQACRCHLLFSHLLHVHSTPERRSLLQTRPTQSFQFYTAPSWADGDYLIVVGGFEDGWDSLLCLFEPKCSSGTELTVSRTGAMGSASDTGGLRGNGGRIGNVEGGQDGQSGASGASR